MPRDVRGRPLESRRRAERSFGDEEVVHRDGSLFIWTVVILLLIGFAFACWIFSFYIFGHPEKQLSYSILSKLKKLEPPKRFELTAAPRGEFLNAKQLWDKYNKMSNRELARVSEALQRDYLRNYKLTQDLVPYVVGSYNILDSYELNDHNFFPSGVVAIAESNEAPYVLLEEVFTADQRAVPSLQRMLLTGLNIRLDRNLDLTAVINVKRLPNNKLLFTAVPLLYGNYAASAGPGTFSLEPPSAVAPKAGFPILSDTQVDDADKKLAAFRLRVAAKSPDAHGSAPDGPRLVRVERPTAPDGAAILPTPTPAPIAEVKPTPTPVAKAVVVKAASPSPSPAPALAVASPTPTPEVPLQPFLTPSPTPASIATTAGGAWPVYAPGQMPRGRLVNLQATADLASQGSPDERTYLQGSFVVTAAGQNRAILRASGGGLSDAFGLIGHKSNIRVLVDFPSGVKPPGEGASVSRDSRRPFLITKVVKASNGDINVYVQEVTRPE